MKRFVAAGGAFAAAVGGILWFLLLMSTAADTVIFSRNYPLLIALNVVLALGMLGLVGWQLRTLWRDYQAQVFGARLKLRLMLMFGVIAVLPGALVYGVSVQFVTRSIESWFDVRVEKALESGLHLGRSALDSLLADVVDKGRSMASELSDIQESSRRSALLRLREEKGVQTAALFSVGGQLLSSATSELSSLMPDLPDQSQLKAARSSRSIGTVEGDGGKRYLRVLVPVSARDMFEEPRILQLTQPVPTALADDADAVQGVYRDYQELQLARDGLTRIYGDKIIRTFELSEHKVIGMAVADVAMTGGWELALSKIATGEMDAPTFHRGIEVFTSQIAKELLEVAWHPWSINGGATFNVNTHHRRHHLLQHRGQAWHLLCISGRRCRFCRARRERGQRQT